MEHQFKHNGLTVTVCAEDWSCEKSAEIAIDFAENEVAKLDQDQIKQAVYEAENDGDLPPFYESIFDKICGAAVRFATKDWHSQPQYGHSIGITVCR